MMMIPRSRRVLLLPFALPVFEAATIDTLCGSSSHPTPRMPDDDEVGKTAAALPPDPRG